MARQLDLFYGALYSEYYGTILVTITIILMELGYFVVHRDNIWQTFQVSGAQLSVRCESLGRQEDDCQR